MDILNETKEGRRLISFLYRHPVQLEYSNTAGTCHKFALKAGQIYLPRDFRGNDLLCALEIAKAAFVYRMYETTNFLDIVSEEEELAALFAARLAIEMNLVEEDYNYPLAKSLKKELCVYITQSSNALRQHVRRRVLSVDRDCFYPLETFRSHELWLEKVKNATRTDELFQALYERDLRRVKLGTMTMSQVMKKDAMVRGLPTYDLYRYQRTFYDVHHEILKSFKKAYSREIKKDQQWREKNAQLIEKTLMEFASCQF